MDAAVGYQAGVAENAQPALEMARPGCRAFANPRHDNCGFPRRL